MLLGPSRDAVCQGRCETLAVGVSVHERRDHVIFGFRSPLGWDWDLISEMREKEVI